MTRRGYRFASRLGSLLVLLFASVSPGRAGDRELEILIVNMTPDEAVTDAARECFGQIRARIRRDYARLHALGETPLRRLARDPDEGFMEWTQAILTPVRESRHYDAIALIDCRPEAATADLLVTSSNHRVARMRLRNVRLDRARASWLGETVLRHAWVGFVP